MHLLDFRRRAVVCGLLVLACWSTNSFAQSACQHNSTET